MRATAYSHDYAVTYRTGTLDRLWDVHQTHSAAREDADDAVRYGFIPNALVVARTHYRTADGRTFTRSYSLS